MSGVYVTGVGMTPLGKLGLTVKEMSKDAVTAALADAGVELKDIQAAWFANTRQGALEGQHGIRGQVALRGAGFNAIPIFNTDNACASSSSALFQATCAIESGFCDLAIVVGAEKMVYPEERRADMFTAFRGSTDIELAPLHFQRLADAASGLTVPEGPPSSGHSVFIDMYAHQARIHMKLFGTTQRQIAAVAAKNHWNSQYNPDAQYRFPMTVEEVLADRRVAWPLTRAMCAPMSDGAAALVLASAAFVRRTSAKRTVRICGIGVSSGTDRAPEDYRHHLTRTAAMHAYERAGVGPQEIGIAELHDATAIAELIQCENVGFCDYGCAGEMAERGETAMSGPMPINVSGGLLSKGHPIAATGALQIVELVKQLRGEAGDRQVALRRPYALAENGGGFYGVEEAACVVTILASGENR